MVTQTQRGRSPNADYLLTPDDVRYELIDGALVMAPAPIPLHQRVVTRFSNRLGPYIAENGLGELFTAPIAVCLSETNPAPPDLLLVVAARARIITETNIQGAPDLVIEVASPRTQEYELTVKRELYARFGAPECWAALPPAK